MQRMIIWLPGLVLLIVALVTAAIRVPAVQDRIVEVPVRRADRAVQIRSRLPRPGDAAVGEGQRVVVGPGAHIPKLQSVGFLHL